MKIAYCTNAICYSGGMERVTLAKANAWANTEGCEVWIIVTDNAHPASLEIDPKVHIVDLKVNYFVDEGNTPFSQFLRRLPKTRSHKHLLQQTLTEIAPDVVVSVGWSEKYFLPQLKIPNNPIFVREIHYPVHYRIMNAHGKLQKIIAEYYEWYDYYCMIKKYDKIVVLTHADKDELQHLGNKVEVIGNPVTKLHNFRASYDNQIVIAAGRLQDVKNYSFLIKAWKSVIQDFPKWILYIYGSGPQYKLLSSLIYDLELNDSVYLKGFSENVIESMSKGCIFVQTSKYEGFPLSILEAMTVGLPIVSVDSPNGPRELVKNGQNGYLTPLDDMSEFIDCLKKMMKDQERRVLYGKNSLELSKSFYPDAIICKWQDLFIRTINDR